MNQYGYTPDYIASSLTKEQIFLFKRRAETRLLNEKKTEARLHGFKIKTSGLDLDGAKSIESYLDSGMRAM
jgi:hypothetical protein